ncbi:hypothetical protein [Rhizobium sp. BK176]|uniref:hypothetical protein n=1 Tax=Rhizobium sp. BK176 TaxID=2587071 RepID=UPI0021674E96|nr:hypothetical protein [Rhizobium sp. BK176]MCS4088535.1 hypothetical protein [Rhizobium sp. BK176]
MTLLLAAEIFRDAADDNDVVDTDRVIAVFAQKDIDMGFVVDLVQEGVVARTKDDLRIKREQIDALIASIQVAE